MPTHKSEDYKLSAVEYYLTEDKTQEEVCKIFKCSARSLLRWVDKYNENGEIKRHNRKPVAYKVHKDQVKFILPKIQIEFHPNNLKKMLTSINDEELDEALNNW